MSAVGQSDPFSDAHEYNAQRFVVDRVLDDVQTMAIVQVKAVNTAALTVDVLVLVNLITGNGTSVPHGVISARPYYRLQGGANGVICDPAVGDIGVMVFASRDSSAVVASRGQANPGSARRFSWSDGVYFGGINNPSPTQYLQFGPSGITVASPVNITIQAPVVAVNASTSCTITSPIISLDGNVTVAGTFSQTGGGNSTMSGSLITTGSVTAGGINLETHTHSGVQSGSSDTGPPV